MSRHRIERIQHLTLLLLTQVFELYAVSLQYGAQVSFCVCILIVNVAIDVKLAIFNDNSFITQFNWNRLGQLHHLGLGFILQVRLESFVGNLATSDLGQQFGKILNLRCRKSHATMRRKGSQLRRRFAAVNERWLTNGDLDWSERIQFAPGRDLLADRYTSHLGDPGLVRRCPGGIEDNGLSLP